MSNMIAPPTIDQAIARGHRRQRPAGEDSATALKRAVIYPRVSTEEQASKGGEAEGYSLPAQREACTRKATELHAEVVGDYLDRGESARLADRPGLQAMMKRIREVGDVDYVIVHKLDRLARNLLDQLTLVATIREHGAQLVSCSEHIDDSPSGRMFLGVLGSLNQYHSDNLATEASKGMLKKAQLGGTPGRAPLGYLNGRDFRQGDNAATIAIDSERADHVRWAFHTYARGQVSVGELARQLEERGLRSIPNRRRPGGPLHRSQVAAMLRNRYYIGIVTFKGVEYAGRHEPLIDQETFWAVQAILDERNESREKVRVHHHYLKGSLFCDRCGSRLIYSRNRSGTGDYYEYFSCAGRLDGCDLGYIPAGMIEAEVEAFYRRLTLPGELAVDIGRQLEEQIADSQLDTGKQAKRARTRLTKLEGERDRLLQAYLDEALELEQFKREQDRIAREIAEATRAIEGPRHQSDQLIEMLGIVLYLCQHLSVAYEAAPLELRRKLNRTLFRQIRVDHNGVQACRVQRVISSVLTEDVARRASRPQPDGRNANDPWAVSGVGGSNMLATLI